MGRHHTLPSTPLLEPCCTLYNSAQVMLKFVSLHTTSPHLRLSLPFRLPDRTIRANWTGTPTDRPSLVVLRDSSTLTAYASWNGATEVTSWKFLGSNNKKHTTVLGNAARTGFETHLNVPPSTKYAWYQVEAMNAAGDTLGYSEFKIVESASSS